LQDKISALERTCLGGRPTADDDFHWAGVKAGWRLSVIAQATGSASAGRGSASRKNKRILTLLAEFAVEVSEGPELGELAALELSFGILLYQHGADEPNE
jgi:hypothetical protein